MKIKIDIDINWLDLMKNSLILLTHTLLHIQILNLEYMTS